jgi:hypothetical protein
MIIKAGNEKERNIYPSLSNRLAPRIRLFWEKVQIKSILRGKFTITVNMNTTVFRSVTFYSLVNFTDCCRDTLPLFSG